MLIQYSGLEYTNQEIIKRAVQNIDRNNFNTKIYPREIGEYFLHLYCAAKDMITGKYDSMIVTEYEKKTMAIFKEKYNEVIKNLKYYNIGIEDYFFINTLFCRANKIVNPEQYNFCKMLERFFMDSIYNNGGINDIYNKFSTPFILWLRQYNNVFTTNFDSNIEKTLQKSVYHLHGEFSTLNDIYNKESKRSIMKFDNCDFIEGYTHLFSNAILDFSGFGKKFVARMNEDANSVVEKFADAYINNKFCDKIESWKQSNHEILRNFYKAIMLRIETQELIFSEYYPFTNFESISGDLVIIGLSPSNDDHLISMIEKNCNLMKVIYYYYDINDMKVINELFTKKDIVFASVKDFWRSV